MTEHHRRSPPPTHGLLGPVLATHGLPNSDTALLGAKLVTFSSAALVSSPVKNVVDFVGEQKDWGLLVKTKGRSRP